MSVDVVCAGSPFLDLVFRGVPRIPSGGEEVLADELVIVPGAMANVAFALRQLDLDAVVCAPIGTDPAGRLLQDLMAAAGIPWLGGSATATPVSVGLPLEGERAFVTVHPTHEVDVAMIGDLAPRAIVANLPLPRDLPAGPRVYGVVGDPQVAILRQGGAASWTDLRALFVNEREAFNLSGLAEAPPAATQLAECGCVVVVTRGERGAVAALPDGTVVDMPGVAVHALDTVGAGDLFAAAFIWADLADRPLGECLAVATAYASHSLAAPRSTQKGLSRAAFLDAARSTTETHSWMSEVRG
jgi:ribokinase